MLRALYRITDVKGRASRSEYWLFGLLQSLVSTGFVTVILVVQPAGAAALVFGLIQLAVNLALIVAGVTVSIRRLHDINRSAWWLLLPILPMLCVLLFVLYVIVVGVGYLAQSGANPASGLSAISGLTTVLHDNPLIRLSPLLSLGTLACYVIWVIFMCSRGTNGPNRFGADPLDPAARALPDIEPETTDDAAWAIDLTPAQPAAPAPAPAPAPRQIIPTVAARPAFGRRGL